MTPLERAVAALESIEAMANARIRPADVGQRAEAATRVANVNAAVSIAQSLERLANAVGHADLGGRLRVEVRHAAGEAGRKS